MSDTKLGPIDQQRLKEFDPQRIEAIEETLEKLRKLVSQNTEEAPKGYPNPYAQRAAEAQAQRHGPKGDTTMNTLFVKVTADCEGVLSHLPRGRDWGLISEEYSKDGSGVIEIGFNHDSHENERALTSAEEQALKTNRGVISYWTV